MKEKKFKILPIVLLVFIITGIIYFILSFEITRKNEIERGNELAMKILRYKSRFEKLPEDNNWELLQKIGFTLEELDKGSPRYNKIDNTHFQIILVKGFDSPYLTWDSKDKKWKMRAPLVGCKKRIFYAENEKQIKSELLNNIAENYKTKDTINIHEVLLGVCGNDEMFNQTDFVDCEDEYLINFELSEGIYTIKNKKIIIRGILLRNEKEYLRKFPQSFKIISHIQGNKITYTLINRDEIEEYNFRIKWKEE